MWVIIISVILFMGLISTYIFRRNRFSNEVTLDPKYQLLIDLLKENKNLYTVRIVKNSASLRLRKEDGFETYTISEVEQRLIIVWTLESKIHGKRGKEWAFSLTQDQQSIFTEVDKDVSTYLRTLARER